MPERQRIIRRFSNVLRTADSPGWIDRVIVPAMLGLGIVYGALQALQGRFPEFILAVLMVGFLLALSAVPAVQRRVLKRSFNRRHALHVAFIGAYGVLWLWTMRVLFNAPSTGKDSQFYYVMLILAIAIMMMILRSLFALTPRGYTIFIVRLPLWEQVLVAINELMAAALLANVAAGILSRTLQPLVFTIRVDPAYVIGLLALTSIYYFGIWAMWFKGLNDWLSKNDVWVRWARLIAPLALIVMSLMINKRFANIGDRRTMDLLGGAEFDKAILAIAPVIWLLILIVIFLVFTGRRGLRRRFLPDSLLDKLPQRIGDTLRTISDVDIVLMVGVLSTSIPVYLFLRGSSSGVVDTLSEQILQRANVLIDSSEQALAILFALPFYVLVVALLTLYASVLADPKISAFERDALVKKLPIGFLIVLIITLYLFSVSFSLVLIEGRLPRLPQDLGRILAFDVLIPLLLLYFHYFVLVRLPYGRGQSRWRANREIELSRDLATTDLAIRDADRELTNLEDAWHGELRDQQRRDPHDQLDALYQFVNLNGRRDKLNMRRLEIVAEKQQLAEVSEAPVSLAVARLPIRVVTFGIPLLLAIQVYQWAVLNDGLRQIANDPNITIVEFFQIILQQVQF